MLKEAQRADKRPIAELQRHNRRRNRILDQQELNTIIMQNHNCHPISAESVATSAPSGQPRQPALAGPPQEPGLPSSKLAVAAGVLALLLLIGFKVFSGFSNSFQKRQLGSEYPEQAAQRPDFRARRNAEGHGNDSCKSERHHRHRSELRIPAQQQRYADRQCHNCKMGNLHAIRRQ